MQRYFPDISYPYNTTSNCVVDIPTGVLGTETRMPFTNKILRCALTGAVCVVTLCLCYGNEKNVDAQEAMSKTVCYINFLRK